MLFSVIQHSNLAQPSFYCRHNFKLLSLAYSKNQIFKGTKSPQNHFHFTKRLATTVSQPPSTSINEDLINHSENEKKWSKRWGDSSRKTSLEILQKLSHNSTKLPALSEESIDRHFYVLAMFPYPSGKLHMGHVRVYTISDAIARHSNITFTTVTHPMGWDAFGLPAENAAIDRGLNPALWTKENIDNMRTTLKSMLLDIDWDKEFATCDPEFYRWTQFLFLQLWKRGLVYQKEAEVNWDPIDKTVLANEQVDKNGCSWRSGAKIEKRKLKQWFIRISKFSESLLQNLDLLENWPEKVKQMQRNWIGKSIGAEFTFSTEINGSEFKIPVFTSRPDTIFGVSYIAISKNHQLASERNFSKEKAEEIKEFIKKIDSFKGINETNSKLGIDTGLFAKHPLDPNRKIPIFIANYVLSDYGSGAVMGVPAHDQRDYDFAISNSLNNFASVIESGSGEKVEIPFCDKGILIKNSQNGIFGGLSSEEASERILEKCIQSGSGLKKTQYKLRDWLVSRQRYWGTPIPFIHCADCGPVPVPDSDLPVKLPLDIQLSQRGGNVLDTLDDWKKVECPSCGKQAKRETDTMDTFVDSSWYYFRFLDHKNNNLPFDPQIIQKDMPVDIYIGGIEHSILHLLYSRFLTKSIQTDGKFKFYSSKNDAQAEHEHFQTLEQSSLGKSEPFLSLLTQDPKTERFLHPSELEFTSGSNETPIVTYEKMSKSKHNGVDPESVISQYGADVTRLYMLFKAPPQDVLEYDTKSIVGIHRWVLKLTRIINTIKPKFKPIKDMKELADREDWSKENNEIYKLTQTSIKMATEVFEKNYSFNTVIASLMTLSNNISSTLETRNLDELHPSVIYAMDCLLIILSPMAPSVSEELFERLHATDKEYKGSIFAYKWPKVDETGFLSEMKTCVVQVNGKTKMTLEVETELFNDKSLLLDKLSSHSEVKAVLLNKKTGTPLDIIKTIVVPRRSLVNYVVSKNK
ncbi:hypothetical protein BB560_002300 [Smittium megazygosporum]|uniref:leucine--tRNA ligase n=1 Tax=Smittium megazygosporum TaxID=133381 RepID=A0A2T9ZF52_9FUNG|nr:hypothetical protein BB560_002300 [Smittium megazygosporum]